MSAADETGESDRAAGDARAGKGAEGGCEGEPLKGSPPRHIDVQTGLLDRYARTWIDLQQTRKALAQREIDDAIVSEFDRLEKRVSEKLKRTLRAHPLWPWLSQYPGLGGAHTALIIGRTGDPRRFPGQRCSEGHYLPAGLFAAGAPCPVAVSTIESEKSCGDGASDHPQTDDLAHESVARSVCLGVMLPPRTTTGVRSYWHWAGLHADAEGRSPRRRKGVQSDWEPRIRSSVLQPGGLAEQIVRLNVPHYADIYRSTKERFNLRVVDETIESERRRGDAKQTQRTAECGPEIEALIGRPLRPFEADRIARKVAAKAFLGDLLIHWKSIVR